MYYDYIAFYLKSVININKQIIHLAYFFPFFFFDHLQFRFLLRTEKYGLALGANTRSSQYTDINDSRL